MKKPRFRFFLCDSFRTNGELKRACNGNGASDLLRCLQGEIADRGMDAVVSTASCLNVAQKGPILVVYPNELWYHEITRQKIGEILDALEEDSSVPSLLTQ